MASECKLCEKLATLEDSHILPKFCGRWLKTTSATGILRNAVNPNIPFYAKLCLRGRRYYSFT